jgi:hypothetical protein
VLQGSDSYASTNSAQKNNNKQAIAMANATNNTKNTNDLLPFDIVSPPL